MIPLTGKYSFWLESALIPMSKPERRKYIVSLKNSVGHIDKICEHCNKPFPANSCKERCCSDLCSIQLERVVEAARKRTPKEKLKRNAFLKIKRATDPEFLFKQIVHKTVCRYFRWKYNPKSSKIAAALPYSIPQLKAHLESQFNNSNGFTWDNYGSVWSLDHIIPQSMFHFTDFDCKAFRDCWALSNLRPLRCPDNLKKGANIETETEKPH